MDIIEVDCILPTHSSFVGLGGSFVRRLVEEKLDLTHNCLADKGFFCFDEINLLNFSKEEI